MLKLVLYEAFRVIPTNLCANEFVSRSTYLTWGTPDNDPFLGDRLIEPIS